MMVSKRKNLGVWLPVSIERVRDADTVIVQVNGQEAAIRLIDCWAKNKNTEQGAKAKQYLTECLQQSDELILHLPIPKDLNNDGKVTVLEIMKQLSFDRVPGWLYMDGVNVSRHLCEMGYAYPERHPDWVD